ncbi:SPOSA6832_00496 [Sporobolomyces salmonicolor]|uniref:SPOSA6832_00496-mRNA-1:cds n=1 Tax=Sporidiobolus salmonicolor TaxID=5005 RepID=A0A0D6EGH0_SPOSA|nr:SPOSA6832_00496 [Sporobolomyces salmonicolor]
MEKFSKWRAFTAVSQSSPLTLQDASTGVAPFLYPLPASSESLPPILQILAVPLAGLLGGLRTLLVVLLLLAQVILVEGVLRIFVVLPPVYAVLARATNAGICRLVLLVLGVGWIKVETVHLRKTGRSPPAMLFEPKKGDLIIGNSSSYIDLLYLAFRFPFFPCQVSLLGAIMAAGKLPERSEGGENLEDAIRKASGPVAVFPEATTSNNRALLRFAELQAPPAGAKAIPVRTFVLAFKYSPPTRLSPSLAYPIPSTSLLLPLSHVFSLTSRPVLYSISIRRLHPSESPKISSAPRKEEWDQLAETLATTARLKRVGGLGWEDKGAFLEFRKVKGR